ncbi:FG-GAP-like repeat-containing protein [Streptomyces sp. NPDC005890]|uniref:FG-GAP-like repeat-containing protein n=1 Tax=Streptomyces sp. NPDC005890 TaxID=3154568 RepID=UPI003405A7C4
MFRSRSHARWALPLTLGLTALGLAVPAVSAAPARSATQVRDDFNGDGYADLAVGAPNATVGGQARAGYVAVLYGGPHGLSAGHRTVISRATPGIPGDPVQGMHFGLQIAKGDLDGDGYADLVAGGVVVWGGPRGLSGGTEIGGNNHQTGDFDGDGRLDLAVIHGGHGMGDDPAGSTAAIWKGPLKRNGTPVGRTPLDPDHLQYVDVHDGDTGDINGDGRADLVLTGYCGDGNNCSELYLSGPGGLSRVTYPYRSGDGAAAIGDLDGDGYDDVVTGFQNDNSVWVMYGGAAGLRGQDTWKRITQDTPGVPGSRETTDMFGQTVAVGDITGDGIDDLAVGAPGENDEGVVDVLRGSRSGLTGAGAQAFGQDTKGVPGTAEPSDAFGYVVRLLDVNHNGHADLVAAAPGEDGSNGAVWVLRGRPSGLVTDAAAVFGGKALGAPYKKASFGFGLR